MRMEADAKHLTALTEENVQLKSQLDAQSSEIRAFETKVGSMINKCLALPNQNGIVRQLAVLEEQKKVAMNSSSSERTMFQAAMSKLEIKLKVWSIWISILISQILLRTLRPAFESSRISPQVLCLILMLMI